LSVGVPLFAAVTDRTCKGGGRVSWPVSEAARKKKKKKKEKKRKKKKKIKKNFY
jgi:hypothetical protein